MTEIKAIIFDLDDTLYDNNPLTEIALEQAVKEMVKNGLKCSYKEGLNKIKKIIKKNPSLDKFSELAKYFNCDDENVINIGKNKYYNADFKNIDPYLDTIDTLEKLKDDYKLVLITSGSKKQQNKKIDVLNIRNYFDYIFIDDYNEKEHLISQTIELLKLKPEEIAVVGDRIDHEIEIGNRLGMKTIKISRGKFVGLQPENSYQEPKYAIENISDIIEILKHDNKIVTIGGGTGTSSILEGLKKYTGNIIAIVNVTDTGRSSGKIRKEMNVIAPGDTRNCLIALANSEKLMCDLFQYRFDNGNLKGYSLGNLFLASLAKITGSFEKAIEEASKILQLKGKVIPSTFDNVNICAELEDGSILDEEDKIIDRGNKKVHLRSPIKKVFLRPHAKANKNAIEEIKKAKLIVICPGSLYTSIMTNLLVDGISDAIINSKAKKVYVCNIMTQISQTHRYKASEHVKKILGYIKKIDYVIINTKKPDKRLLGEYKEENAFLVENDIEELEKLGIKVIAENVLDDTADKKLLWEKKDLLRHDPEKIARILVKLLHS